MKFDMILATDDKNGIGKSGDLAWRIKADMDYFKTITTNTKNPNKINAAIMGYKTWVSIPEKFRPLPNRLNCIITKNLNGVIDGEFSKFFTSFDECFSDLENRKDIENIFIIGGASLYNTLLDRKELDRIYLTEVKGDFGCDVFFNGIPDYFILEKQGELQNEKGISFMFNIYKK